VECDQDGIRRRAQFFNVEGALPQAGTARRQVAEKRPTQAAKIDLFAEPPAEPPVKTEN
jgi:hypothetical protein